LAPFPPLNISKDNDYDEKMTLAVFSHCICNFLQIRRGRPVDIMVPPGKVGSLESDLTGLSYSIMIPDVQKLIDLEKIPSSSAVHKPTGGIDINGSQRLMKHPFQRESERS
jgi:hypothetical protein